MANDLIKHLTANLVKNLAKHLVIKNLIKIVQRSKKVVVGKARYLSEHKKLENHMFFSSLSIVFCVFLHFSKTLQPP